MIDTLKLLKTDIINRQKELDIGQAGICYILTRMWLTDKITFSIYKIILYRLEQKSLGKRYEGDGKETTDLFMFWFPNCEARIKAIDELINELEHEQ
jgi:hypothetical protein